MAEHKLYYNPAYRDPVGAEMLLDHVMYRAQGKHSATVSWTTPTPPFLATKMAFFPLLR